MKSPSPLFNWLLRGLIRLYQWLLSPLLRAFDVLGGGCRYTPTCSEYCRQALLVHGTTRGLWLGVKRLARCAPWGGLGPDPVPPAPIERTAFSVPRTP